MPRISRPETPTTPVAPNTPARPATTPTAPATTPGWRPAGPNVISSVADGFVTPRTPGRPAAAEQVPLDPGGSLFLSKSGAFVSRSGQDRPVTPAEGGETLFRAAALSEGGRNLFENPQISVDQKAAALGSLAAAFEGANPANGSNGFATRDQALQTRASAAPLILDLAKSLDPGKPAEARLQTDAVAQYVRLLESEPHGLARNFMIYDLDRAKGQLPAEVRPAIDTLMREVAPLAPPYEEWFKDGNDTVRLEYYVGDGFWEEELSAYESKGFTRKDNADGTVTLSRKYTFDRPQNDGTVKHYETNAELVMHNGPDGLFDRMNEPKVHGVVYSGHANYGREVPSHLPGGAPQTGAKVFFGLQCGGKGTHNATLEKYPDLQVVTSRNSSYGYQDRATVLNTLEGISRREPWAQISVKNGSNNSDNYYFPTDTLISKRSLDLDHDGKADSWDRVVNYNAFHPQETISRQLTPQSPGKPAAELDGRAETGAVLRFWRMAGYNEWAEGAKDQGVVGGGYFEGKKTDPLFKLTELKGEDGSPVLNLQVNSQYAHAGEEVLGAALHYELGRSFAEKAGLPPADAKAAGLLMAAKALDVDTGYHEEETWKALLAYAKLPAGVRYQDAMHANHANEHYSAGASDTVRLFKASLEAAHLNLD
ncbi:MAG: hypothetical protein ACYC8T_00640 [Myxococcaceae bacterium]